ncbi:centromere protein U isoform X2 [Strigops habroptila]|uniref:centromere protein U isoform X2 n=1 Tax=Strigops habroptila TaxID=2489341 RepID=UPI0011D00C30|nr:centromere protein U isoform X2 [Strigops habroptila]XP_030349004.1 centromere protein U isoform X2 [Strigops habroptila]XP_030349005.1 centromere protein U isoform X2 [Strigops habroptila]
MSSRKKTKRNNSSNKLKEHKTSSHPRKLPSLEEPDVSMIQKVSQANQLEELDNSFDHPLHSTAVDAYGEEHSQSESLDQVSEPRRKDTERSKKNPRSKTSDGDVRKFSTADSEDESLKEDVAKKKRPSEENTSDPSVGSPCSVKVSCPKEIKRSPGDITELDVVLAEFEKITANCRQSTESNICRKAINSFCAAFKDQITDLIVAVQELQNMKKKNAKVLTDIKKKRQRLLQLREEQFEAEPQLIRLQREYTEVQERQSALRQATELLTDLKELQQDCLDYREENPKEKVVYGTSSLPALLVESRRILGAERHFQNINMKLEEALAAQRGKLPEKH